NGKSPSGKLFPTGETDQPLGRFILFTLLCPFVTKAKRRVIKNIGLKIVMILYRMTYLLR
ncbi:MAG: hypothetical protein COZ25_10415, partial [Ignavibacteria bacterium CG_4_10_14_3_um_filter_37_18]